MGDVAVAGSVPGWLARRRRLAGAEPLLTYYDLAGGRTQEAERIELSTTTYGNWVDKTANLLLDADVGTGDRVALPLAVAHPGHWVTLVWWAAVWQAGATVVLPPTEGETKDETEPDDGVAVRVLGPDQLTDPVPSPAELTVACSLHPLGLGFRTPLPDDVVDFGLEVRGFPDTFLGSLPPSPAGAPPADADGDPDARLLIRPTDAVRTVRTALIRPLRGHGSSVIVVGAPPDDQLAAIVRTERATA